MINERFVFENKIEVDMTDGTTVEYTGRVFTPVRELLDYVVCAIEGEEGELPLMISRKDLFKSTKDERFLTLSQRAFLAHGELLKAGVFYEYYPDLTGFWARDEPVFTERFAKLRDRWEEEK